MLASHLIEQLQRVIDMRGDVEVLVECESTLSEITPVVDCDQFEPGGPHYIVLTAEEWDE